MEMPVTGSLRDYILPGISGIHAEILKLIFF
jgi:hypothetical protein